MVPKFVFAFCILVIAMVSMAEAGQCVWRGKTHTSLGDIACLKNWRIGRTKDCPNSNGKLKDFECCPSGENNTPAPGGMTENCQ